MPNKAKKRVFDKDVLFLTIKKKYLDMIKSGKKKIEYRDVTEYYIKKLMFYDEKKEWLDFKPFKYVVFQAGYSKTSPRAKFEIKQILRVKYEADYAFPENDMWCGAGDEYFEIEIGKEVKM